MFDAKTVREQAAKVIAEEKAEKAKVALVKKLRELDAAESVVANIKREIDDLEASIADGSFTS